MSVMCNINFDERLYSRPVLLVGEVSLYICKEKHLFHGGKPPFQQESRSVVICITNDSRPVERPVLPSKFYHSVSRTGDSKMDTCRFRGITDSFPYRWSYKNNFI